MKILVLLPVLFLAAVSIGRADTTTTLDGVHNCCDACKRAITEAVESVRSATVEAKGGTLTLTTRGKSDVRKVMEALNDAGFFCKVADEGSPGEAKPESPAKSAGTAERKVTSATVTGVHLCCQKCRDFVYDAVKAVPGVTKTDVVAKATSFKVEGEFAKTDIEEAINKVGFTCKVK